MKTCRASVVSVSVIVCWALAVVASAAESPATSIAAALIRARAQELPPSYAPHLDHLAIAVEHGEVSLIEAQQVLALIAPPPPLPPAHAGPPPASPPLSPDQVLGVLDGKPPVIRPPSPSPTATVPLEPLPAAATAGPTQPPMSPPAQALTPVAAQPPASSVQAWQPTVIAPVLAVEKADAGGTAVIVIGVGTEKGIKEGQRFAIRRKQVTLVLAAVTQVKPGLSVCVLIPGTWVDKEVEIRNDDEAALTE